MNWLDLYMEYAKNNEAQEQFHWWTAITILGAALRRQVFFSKGYYRVYPFLWTLIVAPSGLKKTTALSIGYNILSKLEHVRIIADKATPEALIQTLAEKQNGRIESQGLIYAPELSSFLDRRQHNDGLVQLLLRLYDAPDTWMYETKGGGKTLLKNVGVSFLGATANDLLYECIPALALKSGFLARFVCVVGKGIPDAVPFPWKDSALENKVLQGLYELSLLEGKMELRAKAQEWYVSWYFRHKAKASSLAETKIQAYYERKPDHLLRVAMLLSIAKHRRLEYTIDTFEEALEKLEGLEVGIVQMAGEIDASAQGKEQSHLLQIVERSGGRITHTALLRKTYMTMDAQNLKKWMSVLIEADLIKVERGKRGGVIYARR